jgi:hypothetical protein
LRRVPDPAPIIFIHYGRAVYLRHTLAAARASNPGKPVFLLGDATNRGMVPRGAKFAPLADYEGGEDLAEFHRSFVPIAGSSHRFNKAGGTDAWLRFVFARWFILRNFAETHGLSEFWTFDSDTLIAADLSVREDPLRPFDATEQCGGCCLNGFIRRRDVVESYCEEIVEAFGDPAFLDAQRTRLEEHTGLAFNEMDVWQRHRDRRGLRTLHLGKPTGGEAFDDALAMHGGWVKAPVKVCGRIPVKYLERDSRGGFFAFLENNREPVRLVTLNLSWLPDYVFQILSPGCRSVGLLFYESGCCTQVSFREPMLSRLYHGWNERLWAIRKHWRNRAAHNATLCA